MISLATTVLQLATMRIQGGMCKAKGLYIIVINIIRALNRARVWPEISMHMITHIFLYMSTNLMTLWLLVNHRHNQIFRVNRFSTSSMSETSRGAYQSYGVEFTARTGISCTEVETWISTPMRNHGTLSTTIRALMRPNWISYELIWRSN